MTLQEYVTKINREYKTDRATEHSYRGYLKDLIESIAPHIMATNEPIRIECGAPDYILTKNDIPIGYIEAKDVGLDLGSKSFNEQFERYRKSLDNLIFTDYIDFWLYIEGEFIKKIRIAEIRNGEVKAIPENFSEFTNLIKDFCTHVGQTIKSSKKLAEMMAGKARMLCEVIENALIADEADSDNPDTALQAQLHAFKEILIHDINPKTFADIYAQTIAYGMFAARLHDPTLPTFSRQEAAELIPKTNPFLRKLFQYIAGYDLDIRLVWIVDGLAEIFRATDVAAILKNFGKATQSTDPIIHFYENFLTEYDPGLRKDRGVWYTPKPIVNFIVRAVDDILKSEFNLKDGLANTSKTKIEVKVVNKSTTDRRSKLKEEIIEKEVHKVQILDPATGTGTFLAEVVKTIYAKFENQQGVWGKYVDDHLVPRLNGFELLMASYAMAHLTLDMLLSETGYKQSKEQRFRIYLTNSLEEFHKDSGTLFANWLSAEANEANHIKRDTPVMVVLGNPPYKGISTNNGKWISDLIEDYKYIDGVHFKERKHWLNDDYVKFIRYGQHFIEKNGSGILAFINPHGFLDNPTFRGMRWHLLKTYDKIYTIDLHGNGNKKEVSPDGSPDGNVFDILQGVSINIFIKTGKKKTDELGKVFHAEVYGKKEVKYDYLNENNLKTIQFKELKPEKPFLFFVPKSDEGADEYHNGFRVDELFPVNVTGIVTARDGFVIDFDEKVLKKRMQDFADTKHSDQETRNKFFGNKKDGKYFAGDSRGWKMVEARKAIKDFKHSDIIQKISYRLFDDRYIYYHSSMVDWGREKYMYHFINKDNLAIDLCRQLVTEGYSHIFITNKIVDDSFVSNKSRERGYVFPLYLYPEVTTQQSFEKPQNRRPNLDPSIIGRIVNKFGLKFSIEKNNEVDSFSPEDILDYVYAVLHSRAYRSKYKEFLKVDFPRIPYPKRAKTFFELINLGGELRQIHLLESPLLEKSITEYPIDANNVIEQIKYENNKVFINDTQYFGKVSDIAWNLIIGGYQPAQKWLKDRKERELSFEDIQHYQKIIAALTLTDKLMKQIDEIKFV